MLRELLKRLKIAGLTIDAVYTLPTNVAGQPQLVGVRVVDVSLTSVTFESFGSPAPELITVAIDKIVAIEHPPVP